MCNFSVFRGSDSVKVLTEIFRSQAGVRRHGDRSIFSECVCVCVSEGL